MEKQCSICGETKPLDGFYNHPKMPDGRQKRCKDCCKAAAVENWKANRERNRAYDKQRFQRPERKAAIGIYQKRRRQRFPHKDLARTMVGNAIRDGRLIRQPCEVCGNSKSQAHHDDYYKPLDVRWLCFVHHREVHGQEAVPLVSKAAA